ncbi:MAG TPA: lipase maturation factor family protein [Polyangia bacterium]|jgi:hypothetical protein
MATTDPPRRPVLIWDGGCGFCARWIARWRVLTGEAVEYLPAAEATRRFPALPRARLDEARLPAGAPARASRPGLLAAPLGAGLLALSAIPLAAACGVDVRWPAPLLRLHRRLGALQCANAYGLFAVMTTDRPELIIEGSDDGEQWQAYELPWKPGDPRRRPRFTGLHMPRLDWQLWFAALHPMSQERWLTPLLARLLEGSPEVLALFGHNPFPDRPPRYLRVRVYRYRFASPAEHRRTGAWWTRELAGDLLPAVTLGRGR